MMVRVISDLHIDVNRRIPLAYDDDVFTVICGDISGYAEDTIEWVAENRITCRQVAEGDF